ncbi:MAG: MATE family efflux transporter [Candidatus Ventricola sp.]
MKTQIAGDLLAGPVAPLIVRIAVPSMAGMLASSLGALVDALLLSRGNTQLSAAVSVSFSLLTLIQTLGFTLGMGAGSFVSRSLGRGDKPAAFAAASTAFFTALSLSVLLCALGALFAAPLVRLLGSPEDVVPAAAVYARYVLSSGPLLCASLVLSSLLRAQGKTLPNMLAFTVGAAAGVALEVLLVRGWRLGVHGGGVSMLVREVVTLAILAVAVLREKRLVRPRVRGIALRVPVYRDIMRSGLPTLLRQGLMSVSSILLTRESAAFGAAALAGIGLCVRAASLVASAVIGFGQGFQPVCGVAFGAGDMDRVRAAYRFCQRCVILALCAVGAWAFCFAEPLLALFGPEEDVLAVASAALRAQSAVFFAQGAVIMMNMLTQALGLTARASLVATSRQGFVFIPLVLLLPRLLGLTGLILCQSVSDVVSLLLCFLITRGALTGSSCARGGCSDARTASR